MEINCLHLNSRSITFFFSLVYFAEKGLDNDRRAEDGEGRKALDLVNIFPHLSLLSLWIMWLDG